jgi:hypothetical protein
MYTLLRCARLVETFGYVETRATFHLLHRWPLVIVSYINRFVVRVNDSSLLVSSFRVLHF